MTNPFFVSDKAEIPPRFFVPHGDTTRPATGKDWIQTYTGRKFFPLAPRENDIDLADIAHALAHQCRFTGHTTKPYSVAEHSLHVARQVLLATGSYTEALAGLLHDASEAYLTDLARPVKQAPSMQGYRDAEEVLQRLILKRYGLPTELPESVHIADERMLATEARDLMAPLHPDWKLRAEPYGFKVECMSAASAKSLFIREFHWLAGLAC